MTRQQAESTILEYIDIEHQLKKVETEILKHKDPELWKE